MADKFSEGIRSIIMAGVGAAAITVEKSKELIEELVKKGELTMEQGNIINEELKNNIKDKYKQAQDKFKRTPTAGEVLDSLDSMSAEDIAAIRAKLNEMEKE